MIENNNTGHEPEYLGIALCFVIAMVGGVAKELSKFETCFNIKRFFSNIFVSGFCGLMCGLMLPSFEHKNLIMFCSGISGVLGISILDYCGELFKAVLNHIASQAIGHTIEVKERAKRIHKKKIEG